MPPRAIDLALDLARMPALSLDLRQQPLPDDILQVIRIAASCPEASKNAVAEKQEPLRAIRQAAAFYLEEMLFFPKASAYRNLGVSPDAPRAQIRLHMRWLLRWLHPDHNLSETAALLAPKVIEAWRELEGRDRQNGNTNRTFLSLPYSRANPAKSRKSTVSRIRWIAVPITPVSSTRRRSRRAVVAIAAAIIAAALIILPATGLFGWLSNGDVNGFDAAAAARSARDTPISDLAGK